MTDIRTQIGNLIDAHIGNKDTAGLAREIAAQITVAVMQPKEQPAAEPVNEDVASEDDTGAE